MITSNKTEPKYKTIGEVSKELGLIDKKTGSLQTHTLRYWESQFKEIKPIIRAGKRRYYSEKDLRIIKRIKFLLKDKGLTINGVKKMLNKDLKSQNDDIDFSQKKIDLERSKVVKSKLKKIYKIIKELKGYK